MEEQQVRRDLLRLFIAIMREDVPPLKEATVVVRQTPPGSEYFGEGEEGRFLV